MIRHDYVTMWIDEVKVDGLVSVEMKPEPTDTGAPDAIIRVSNTFNQFSLAVHAAMMSLHTFASAWGDPIEYAKRVTIEYLGITEIDIRRVDLARWQVVMWNGRKVELP